MIAAGRHKAPEILGAAVLLLFLAACGQEHAGQSAEQDEHAFASIRGQALPGTLLASYEAHKACLAEHLDDPETACEAYHIAWHAEIVEYLVVSRNSGGTENERLSRAKATTEASLAAFKTCLIGHLSDPEYACDAGRRTWVADVVEYATMRNRARTEQTSDQ